MEIEDEGEEGLVGWLFLMRVREFWVSRIECAIVRCVYPTQTTLMESTHSRTINQMTPIHRLSGINNLRSHL